MDLPRTVAWMGSELIALSRPQAPTGAEAWRRVPVPYGVGLQLRPLSSDMPNAEHPLLVEPCVRHGAEERQKCPRTPIMPIHNLVRFRAIDMRSAMTDIRRIADVRLGRLLQLGAPDRNCLPTRLARFRGASERGFEPVHKVPSTSAHGCRCIFDGYLIK